MMKITYKIKREYGNNRLFPVSKDAIMICELTGRKTLSDRDVLLLVDNGHVVEEAE